MFILEHSNDRKYAEKYRPHLSWKSFINISPFHRKTWEIWGLNSHTLYMKTWRSKYFIRFIPINQRVYDLQHLLQCVLILIQKCFSRHFMEASTHDQILIESIDLLIIDENAWTICNSHANCHDQKVQYLQKSC